MESRECAILGTLVGVSKTYGKKYCYPSQKTILRLVSKYHGFEFSRRTLNRDLKELEVDGFIRRVRRLTERGIHGGRFSSTLYKFTHKAFKYLFGLGKWVEGVFSSFRVPKLAHNKSQRENDIFSEFPPTVDNLWKFPIKGRASPSEAIL